MFKDDSYQLLFAIATCKSRFGGYRNWEEWAFCEIGMHYKRTSSLLEKWQDKGYFESGVSVRTGWITQEGYDKAKEAWIFRGGTEEDFPGPPRKLCSMASIRKGVGK